ncbi:MAG: GntR family transcriptional regulator [Thermomicrobium sp.]|nr:GntR family transcriptional regulator [Thermomicrobium sp.]
MTVPLYVQIREALIERIQSGEWGPGTRIPAERDLALEFRASRGTIRQAIADLVAKGLLVRARGSGTFVAEPKIEMPTHILLSFTEAMRRQGIEPGARLVSCEVLPASRKVADRLRLRMGESVYRVVRVRLGNRQPMALEFSHFPTRLCPGLERFDLERNSIYEVLREEYGLVLVRAQQVLEPTLAREFEAEVLEVPRGAPLMLWERVAFTAAGVPVEYAKDLYRGDRVRFAVVLHLPG